MSLHHGYARATPITPSDTTDLAAPCEALLVCSSGNVVFRNQPGVDITVTGATPGQVLPVKVRRVLAAGTTATVVGLWGQ